MASRFEKAFGVEMETLVRMQNSFDIARTRSREKLIQVRPFEAQLRPGVVFGFLSVVYGPTFSAIAVHATSGGAALPPTDRYPPIFNKSHRHS